MPDAALIAVLATCGIAFALGELLLSALGARRPHVTIRGWAAGFGGFVLMNRWAHSQPGADGRWLHYAAIGAGVALTALWLNEPERLSPLRR